MTINQDYLQVIYTELDHDEDLTVEEILHQAWQESGAYIYQSFADYKTAAFKINQ